MASIFGVIFVILVLSSLIATVKPRDSLFYDRQGYEHTMSPKEEEKYELMN